MLCTNSYAQDKELCVCNSQLVFHVRKSSRRLNELVVRREAACLNLILYYAMEIEEAGQGTDWLHKKGSFEN